MRSATLVLLTASSVNGLIVAGSCTKISHHGIRLPRAEMALADNERIDGFIGYEDQRKEAELQLSVVVSSDESLWESNGFSQWEGGEWMQVSVDEVVLLATYLAFKAAKLFVTCSAKGFNEETELPVLGRQSANRWIVHGYVSDSVRIVRSAEGSSYGQWYLQTIAPDATPTMMKYRLRAARGTGCVQTFERC